MARLVTLQSLLTQSQQRADMENSTFLSQTEWITNINNSATRLYDILTRTFEDYYSKQMQLQVDTGQFLFNLPSDFYKLSSLDEVTGGTIETDTNTGLLYINGQALSIKPFNYQNRNRYTTPMGLRNVLMSYIPTMPALVNLTDTFDGINGYEEIIIIDAAIKAGIKEEDVLQELRASKQEILDDIKRSAPNRDAGRPLMMTDVNRDEPYVALYAPTRLRYYIQGQVLRFAEAYVYGDVW